jgi:lysyl endopeptidase
MTNQHCIASNSDALNTDFEFMGEETSCGATNGNCWMCQRGEIFDAKSLVKVSGNKDYALVQLKGGPVAKYGYLDLDNRAANVGEEIYIPQHPGGRAKVCFPYGLLWDSFMLLLNKIT